MRLILPAILLLASLAGCLSEGDDACDECPREPSPAQGRALDPVAYRGDTFAYGPVTGYGDGLTNAVAGSGQGIWVRDDILYWTSGGDVRILDITDPGALQELAALEGISARDIDVLDWHGATYAVAAAGGPTMHIIDVTDPTSPEIVSSYGTTVGVHNLAALPGTPYIYVSGASGDRVVEVVDITDPTDPASHFFDIPASMDGTQLNSDGCHDITVRADLARAYCAGGGGQYMSGGGETFIWDITDPLQPVWVSFLDDPRVVYNHQAMVNDDGTILIVDDEFLGPNCASVELPGVPSIVEPKIPTGAAWIWDISDETSPALLGFVQNDAVTRHVGNDPSLLAQDANCGSHFGDVVPGQPVFVMGWYGGGTIMVDYADPADPSIIDVLEAQGSTWDARVHNGHVFHSSGDLIATRLV